MKGLDLNSSILSHYLYSLLLLFLSPLSTLLCSDYSTCLPLVFLSYYISNLSSILYNSSWILAGKEGYFSVTKMANNEDLPNPFFNFYSNENKDSISLESDYNSALN